MELELNYEVGEWDVPDALFVREVVDRGLNYCESTSYESVASTFGAPDGFDGVLVQRSEDHEYALFRFGDVVVYGCIARGRVSLRAAGSQDFAREAIARIRAVCPEVQTEDRQVSYRFWFLSNGRSRNRERSIDVPAWDEIALNYNAETAEGLEAMFVRQPAATGGALNLWFGPPGTGKTFAVRALSWAWRDWCDFEYVLDPERFFSDADYMLSVLLYEPDDDERWRTLILEDGGDMLRLDAKDGTSHGLSRLLNVADGLIGQGLQVQFLITTNEQVTALNPAVTRPGRCGAEVEFKLLTYTEASRWMSRKGMALAERSSFTLADLFAICDGTATKTHTTERTLGFTA